MEDLLYLVHRIPYPPNKGDKIRSFHLLQQLRLRYRVHLGAFIDDLDDLVYQEDLARLCESVLLLPVNPTVRKVYSAKGLLTGQALSLPYYFHPEMARWVKETITAQQIKKSLIFSSTMAQYVAGQSELRSWIDFVDVDSDKWRQYSAKKSGIARYIYQRESNKLLQYERDMASQSMRSFFVSEREADLFKQLAPEVADRIDYINNGVDVSFFSPDHELPNPFENDGPVMVFTGAMDYWANVDAVCWFAEEVFPAILEKLPLTEFYIVGSKPAKAVLDLGKLDHVHVTGRVEDVRPYLAHANLVVAPMRIARGIQNKVLEGLAVGKPIVATTAAMEGLDMANDLCVYVADDAEDFASASLRCLTSPQKTQVNRQFVSKHFSWGASGEKLLRFMDQ